MKHYNLKHEVTISSGLKLIENQKLVEGKKAKYINEVDILTFYQRTENNSIAKVYINKDLIIDLYQQIQEIESEVTEQTYFDIPF